MRIWLDFRISQPGRFASESPTRDSSASQNQRSSLAHPGDVGGASGGESLTSDEGREPVVMRGRGPKPSRTLSGSDLIMTGCTQNAFVFFNALKNKQLRWKNGIIPYEMDPAFSDYERKLLEQGFSSYHKNTCVRFQPRKGEHDFLTITKGFGCYSQVGRTGGKQEISLGRGCLFHEIIVHELMHSVGFWHEHSRADRDDHIKILWDNILPGMKSQFDKISAALQDTQGEKYDYRSIMHYDSTAFSRNGKNTIETVEEGYTDVIGSATDLSQMDIVKVSRT
ncbi:astacin [Oesophagostomum dentatum]|uniref:Metalloendopeptidase n=1 Tax=Oesophagostomum dentatum TaxID=61180 RepID=A0A0B1SX74_OESDE|nr:astacin [Oesophagostomum dentatum]